MFETMRKVFGPAAVTLIVGAIALVFVFYGVYNPRSTSGTGEGALAATVNGDAVSMQEFYREYQQRVDFYQNMMKGKADPAILRQLGLRNQVLEDLIRRKLMLQEAERLGLSVSDEEVRDKIREMPYFQKEGKFDAAHYERVLQANRYVPSTFEESIREDLLRSQLSEFMRGRARVSKKEIETEFLTAEDRRQVDYAALSRESAKKALLVRDEEVDELLKSESGLGSAKNFYEQNKFLYLKQPPKPPVAIAKTKTPEEPPKPEYLPFDEVKRKVAAEVLKERRSDEISKINREAANALLARAKSSPAAFRAEAKKRGYEVKTSEKFNRLQNYVAGLGEVPELVEDAFKAPSPLEQGPKIYESRASFVVVQGLKAFKPNLADLEKETEKLASTAAQRKEQMMYEQWMTDLRSKAKVSVNESVRHEEN